MTEAMQVSPDPEFLQLRPNSTDTAVSRHIWQDGAYNIPFRFFPSLVIDGGANIGCSSLYFATRFPGVKVIAVEPESANFAQLVLNTKARPNIEPRQAGIWARPGVLSVSDPGRGNASFQVSECQGGSVLALTMAELLAGVQGPALVKLDIEGAERELFSADCSWLSCVGALIIETHDRHKPGCTRVLLGAMRGRPFERYAWDENLVFARPGAVETGWATRARLRYPFAVAGMLAAELTGHYREVASGAG